jgi:hypothetical protein
MAMKGKGLEFLPAHDTEAATNYSYALCDEPACDLIHFYCYSADGEIILNLAITLADVECTLTHLRMLVDARRSRSSPAVQLN